MKKIIAISAATACLLFSAAAQAAAPDGSAIYKKSCVTCHGLEGETPKGNAKNGIKMLSSAEVQRMLAGYADGSYGGSAKSVMQNVAKNLDPDQTRAVSDYVGSLKK